MFLDKDKYFLLNRALVAFDGKRPVSIMHHSDVCCSLAKSWFLGMDRSSLIFSSPSSMPLWIMERYNWGPSTLPIYWCQVISSETLDCGVLAALARECLYTRGVQVLPAQLVLWVPEQHCVQWTRMWQDKGIFCDWIVAPFVYHEICAVLWANTVMLWDPSNNWRIDPNQSVGYFRPAALRIIADLDASVRWGDKKIKINEWETFSC